MSASPTEGTDMNQIEKVARAICAADPEIRMGDAEHIVQQLVNTEWRNYTDAAKAAIAAMQPAPQWQAIESAPRDGTEFQAWLDRGYWEPRCRFNPDSEMFEQWGRVDYDWDGWDATIGHEPTHWMPHPTPPVGGSDAE